MRMAATLHVGLWGTIRAAGVVPVVEATTLIEPVTGADASALAARHGTVLLRLARRYSLCADDAEDALASALEILLTRSADVDRTRLLPWMRTVVAREALAIRKLRLRALGDAPTDPVARAPSDAPGPFERLAHHERVERAARLLRRLKPHERRALALQAQGYSYAEIQEITGWTHTKVNRCLAEGRARLRELREAGVGEGPVTRGFAP